MEKITASIMQEKVNNMDFGFFDELMNSYNEYCDNMRYYDDRALTLDELVDYIEECLKPYDAFCLGCNADFNWSDEVFYFDGYANVKSASSALMYFDKCVDFGCFSEWFNENVAEYEDDEEFEDNEE